MGRREPMGMEETVRKEAVRFAIQTMIFCGGCKGILDLPSAILVTAKPAAVEIQRKRGGKKPTGSILCGKCWTDLECKLATGWGEIFDIWTGKGKALAETVQ